MESKCRNILVISGEVICLENFQYIICTSWKKYYHHWVRTIKRFKFWWHSCALGSTNLPSNTSPNISPLTSTRGCSPSAYGRFKTWIYFLQIWPWSSASFSGETANSFCTFNFWSRVSFLIRFKHYFLNSLGFFFCTGQSFLLNASTVNIYFFPACLYTVLVTSVCSTLNGSSGVNISLCIHPILYSNRL